MAGLTPRKRLRVDEFLRLAKKRNLSTQEEIAVALRVDQSLVSRVLNQQVRPGERFIDGCVQVWGYAVVYEVLLEADEEAAVEQESTADEAAA